MAFSDREILYKSRLGRPVIHRAMPELPHERHTYGLAPPMEDHEPLIEPSPRNLNPAGFDLTVGFAVVESDTLVHSISEQEFMAMKPKVLSSDKPHVLQHDKYGRKIYYITSMERLNLSPNLEALVDARSTTGRTGCMCHDVGQTYRGEKIIAVQPYAFPIQITPGKTRLSQAIIRYAHSDFIAFDKLKQHPENIALTRNKRDVFNDSLHPSGLVMTLATNLVYAAKESKEPIDMDAAETLDPNEYFEIIEGNSHFTMDASRFYLAGTRETITLGNVCGRISRETEMSGTGLWSHFAGYIQPGFAGPITLECYSFVNRTMKKGMPVGFIIFDEVEGHIQQPYKGSYQNQVVPRLPKMFKEFSKTKV